MGTRLATHPHLSRPEHPACTGTENRAWTPASLLRAGVGLGPTSSPNPLLLVGRACAGEGGPRLCPQGDPVSTRRTGWKAGLQAQALAASTLPSLPGLWSSPVLSPLPGILLSSFTSYPFFRSEPGKELLQGLPERPLECVTLICIPPCPVHPITALTTLSINPSGYPPLPLLYAVQRAR